MSLSNLITKEELYEYTPPLSDYIVDLGELQVGQSTMTVTQDVASRMIDPKCTLVKATIGGTTRAYNRLGGSGNIWSWVCTDGSSAAITAYKITQNNTSLTFFSSIHVSPNLTLNGSITGNPSWYAPTSAPGGPNYIPYSTSMSSMGWISISDSSSASSLSSTSISIPTVRDIYYGLPTINNSHTYTSSTEIYAPVSPGISGRLLKSNGSGAPSWMDSTIGSSTLPVYISNGTIAQCSRTIPFITLNGSSTTSPNFYAPLSSGNDGYILRSNGTGAPTWLINSGVYRFYLDTTPSILSNVNHNYVAFRTATNRCFVVMWGYSSGATGNPSTTKTVTWPIEFSYAPNVTATVCKNSSKYPQGVANIAYRDTTGMRPICIVPGSGNTYNDGIMWTAVGYSTVTNVDNCTYGNYVYTI